MSITELSGEAEYTTHRMYGTCRGYLGNKNHRTNIICDGCGEYVCEECGREPPHIVKRSQPEYRWICENCYEKWHKYAFNAESFNAQYNRRLDGTFETPDKVMYKCDKCGHHHEGFEIMGMKVVCPKCGDSYRIGVDAAETFNATAHDNTTVSQSTSLG